jgi:hypothetical protein
MEVEVNSWMARLVLFASSDRTACEARACPGLPALNPECREMLKSASASRGCLVPRPPGSHHLE